MMNKIKYYNFIYDSYKTVYGCDYFESDVKEKDDIIYYYQDSYIGGIFDSEVHNENLYLSINYNITQYVDVLRDILPYLEELCSDKNNVENLRLAYHTITNYNI